MNDIFEEMSYDDCDPDFDTVRYDLEAEADVLCSFGGRSPSKGFRKKVFEDEEAKYGRLCLDLLRYEKSPLSAEELSLPFLVIDFFRLAAERFAAGDIEALGNSAITFEDAIEFICSLNMPDTLKKVIAKHAAYTAAKDKLPSQAPEAVFKSTWKQWENIYLSHLNDSLSVWQIKIDRPCNVCINEMFEMHGLLKTFFENVLPPDAVKYEPVILEPPYTLERLYQNLMPFECRFHEISDEENFYQSDEKDFDGFRMGWAHYLYRLSTIKHNDPFKKLKIKFICYGLEYFCFSSSDHQFGESVISEEQKCTSALNTSSAPLGVYLISFGAMH